MNLIIAWGSEFDEQAYATTMAELGIADAQAEIIDYMMLPACHVLLLDINMAALSYDSRR